jgi:hypothetical protein
MVITAIAWLSGVIIGKSFYAAGNEAPGLILIFGFIILAALASVFYFGKISPLVVFALGVFQNPYFWNYPLATLLLGLCTVAAALYGKTLGNLALTDFYENGETRLPGYTVAAFLDFALILVFSLVVWFLYGVLPSSEQLAAWLPLASLGV